MYEREWLLTFQSVCRDAPPQLKTSVSAVVCAPEQQQVLRDAVFAAQAERERAVAAQKKELKIRPVAASAAIGGPDALGKADERWVPGAAKKAQQRTVEQSFLSNLNKLTLENFALLSKQLVELVRSLSSLPQLQACVALVFDKALGEPKFAAMYAHLCAILAAHAPYFEPAARGGPAKASFRSELLNRAQDEFESELVGDALTRHLEAQLGAAAATPAALDDAAAKYRARKLGNIKLIAELYKLGLLKSGTLRAGVLAPLLAAARAPEGGAARDAAIEKLVKLLSLAGEALEQREIAVAETYFLAVRDLSQLKEQLPARVHFLLLNVLELRANKWVSRRKPDAPQRIGELHAEAHDADFAYLLPADMLTAMSKAAAALPTPSGRPSRTPAGDYVLVLPGGAAAAAAAAAAAGETGDDTAATSAEKKKGKVAFAEPVATPEERIASLVAELFSSHDVDEAVTAFRELPKDDARNIAHLVGAAVEHNAPPMAVMAKLLIQLVEKKVVTREIVSDAVRDIVVGLADTAIDFPSAPKFVGYLLRDLFSSRLIDGPRIVKESGLPPAVSQKIKDAAKEAPK